MNVTNVKEIRLNEV